MRSRLTHLLLFLMLAISLSATHALADGLKGFQAGDVLRGRFVQERFLQGFANSLKSEGTFILVPGQGLIWRAEKPFAVVTLMTRNGLAQQSDGVTTLNLPASRAPFMAGLYDMLSGALAGDWHALERDFTVAKTETVDGWRLQLTPAKKAPSDAMPVTQIDIAGQEYVERVEILKVGGDRDVLTFLNQQLSTDPLDADDVKLLDAIGQP
jgi:hypothetical protein